MILLIALAIRGVLCLSASVDSARFFRSDSFEYERLALNWLHYGVFSLSESPPLEPEILWTPGYPLFMAGIYAVVGHRPEWILLIQVLLSTLTVALVYVIAKRLRGQTAAVSAGLILAVDPASAIYANYLLTETLFTIIFTASISLIVLFLLAPTRWRYLALASLLLGVSSLIRPVALYFPMLVFIGLPLWLRQDWRRGFIAAAVLLIIYSACVGIWVARNHRATGGRYIFSAHQSKNLLRHWAVPIEALSAGTDMDTACERLMQQLPSISPESRDYSSFEGPATCLALKTILGHPLLFAIVAFIGVARLAFGPGRVAFFRLIGDDPPILFRGAYIFTSIAFLATVYLLASIGLYRTWRQRKHLAATTLLCIVIAYFALASSSAIEGNARFRVPFFPEVAVLAGYGVSIVLKRRTSE